jgi:hypothetical protein
MYQTAVNSATRLSRIAGPVCITRLAIRPAKSFWKKLHDWRTTCQWLCQRMRLATLAAIAWLATMFCRVSAAGRSTRSTPAIASKIGQNAANRLSGGLPVIKVTMRPMKTGISASSSATAKPAPKRQANKPLAWRA